MDLQTAYRNIDVSHLAIDEVEHELLIRNMLFHFDDHDSVKRRKLKDRMKEERSRGINSTAFARTWRTAQEEIEIVRSRIRVIRGIYENPKADARQRQKLRTRVVHYRVRINQLARATDARKYLAEISDIENQIDEIMTNYFDLPNLVSDTTKEIPLEEKISEVLGEVRTEIATLNDTVATLEGGDDGGELDQACGGATNITSQRKHEMELSKKRTDEIMEKLNEYEPGKEKDFEHLISAFKDFVVHTSEQQRLKREQEILAEQQRIKEMASHIKRKQNLEKLLSELNENLKQSKNDSTTVLDTDHASPSDQSTSSESECEIEPRIEPPKTHEKFAASSSKPRKASDDERKSRKKVEFPEDLVSSKDSSDEDDQSIGKGKKRRGLKSSQRKRDKGRSEIKKRKKIVRSSTSSEQTLSSDSSESTESSSLSSSTYTSSTEEERRKKKRSKRKHKKSRKAIKRIPVAEWRLKYDGKDEGRKLAEFLKEVKMRCRSEDISDRELFRSALHLFSGRAKDWYIDGIDNGDFKNWPELKKELKREFLPPDLDFQLEIQATSRRQTRGEKFSDYFHDMQKIFQSMTKQLSERRKFDLIWRNMRHDYKNALTGAGIRSLSKLKKYGRKIDENFSFLQKTNENRSRNNQVGEITSNREKGNTGNSGNNTRIFTNSKHQSSRPKNPGEGKREGKEEADKVGKESDKGRVEQKLPPMEGSSTGTMQALVERYRRPPIGTCYNCRTHGHHYVECSEPKSKFCHVCGFLDVFTSMCPVCQKNSKGSA